MASISGGTKLATVLAKVAANAANAKSVDVGFLGDASYANGTNIATVAAIQEFGAPSVGIPPRPFFRNMIAAKSGEWPKAVAGAIKANDYDARKTLDQIGGVIAAQLKNSIINTNDPPLSPVTLMLRKMRSEGVAINGKAVAEARRRVAAGESSGLSGTGAKPLIDTSKMLGSIDHRVD